MTAKFELFEDARGAWRWRLRHANGNILADSGQGYTTQESAINGIAAVRASAGGAIVERLAPAR